jgi:hypothetical protein
VDDDVRQIFQDQLSGLPEPGLGTLVEDSMRQGRRMRAVRRAYGAAVLAGSLAVAAVVTVQTGLGSHAANRLTAAASQSARAQATPEGVLALLLEDLPSGQTSHYAKALGGDLHVQAFLDDGSGPGLIRLAVLDRSTWISPKPQKSSPDERSWRLPNGNTATVATTRDRCVQSLHVDVVRPNGVVVSVDVGSCLAWDGFLLGHGRLALTQQQAIEIANDPRWGFAISEQSNKSGGKRFSNLATFDQATE